MSYCLYFAGINRCFIVFYFEDYIVDIIIGGSMH